MSSNYATKLFNTQKADGKLNQGKCSRKSLQELQVSAENEDILVGTNNQICQEQKKCETDLKKTSILQSINKPITEEKENCFIGVEIKNEVKTMSIIKQKEAGELKLSSVSKLKSKKSSAKTKHINLLNKSNSQIKTEHLIQQELKFSPVLQETCLFPNSSDHYNISEYKEELIINEENNNEGKSSLEIQNMNEKDSNRNMKIHVSSSNDNITEDGIQLRSVKRKNINLDKQFLEVKENQTRKKIKTSKSKATTSPLSMKESKGLEDLKNQNFSSLTSNSLDSEKNVEDKVLNQNIPPTKIDEDAFNLLVNEKVPNEYWKELAEQRRIALEEALKENQMLHEQLEILQAENEQLTSIVKDAENLAMQLKGMIE